jgi:hypothetical protein
MAWSYMNGFKGSLTCKFSQFFIRIDFIVGEKLGSLGSILLVKFEKKCYINY